MLNIAIPTYNRPLHLKQTVACLLPQLGEEEQIVILDNASTPPVDLAWFGDPELLMRKIRIVRNRVNIGADANILRCFENVPIDCFMWLLSDDDLVSPDALAIIRDQIATHPQVSFFNFSFRGERRVPYATTGVEEFIAGIDHYGDVLLISNGVYRVRDFFGSLIAAYHSIHAFAPHVALVLHTLAKDRGRALFLPQAIVEGNAENPENVGWSLTQFAVCRMDILMIDLPHEARTRLGQIIYQDVRVLNHSFVHCLIRAEQGKKQEARFILRRVHEQNWPYATWRFRLAGFLVRLILATCPRLALMAIKRIDRSGKIVRILHKEGLA